MDNETLPIADQLVNPRPDCPDFLGRVSPCNDCPFKIGSTRYVSEHRAREMALAVLGGQPHVCHKTYYAPDDQQRACAGAMVFAQQYGVQIPNHIQGKGLVWKTIQAFTEYMWLYDATNPDKIRL
jgi:hypothetical protein